MAPLTSSQSSWVRVPLRILESSTLASMARSLIPSCSLLISSENMTTLLCCFMAAFCAMLSIRADFPMDGRAARMTRSEFWKPDVILSRAVKPEGSPGSFPPFFSISRMDLMSVSRTSCILSNWLDWRLFAMSNITCSAWSSTSLLSRSSA